MVPSGETELAEANAIGSRATRRPETARHLEFPGSESVPQRMHRNIAVPTHCRLSWCELCKFGGGGAAGAGAAGSATGVCIMVLSATTHCGVNETLDRVRRIGIGRVRKCTGHRGGIVMAHEPCIWPRAFLALSFAVLPSLAHAEVTTLVCTNTNSGATWDIKVDFDHRTADSFPADIGDQWITWEDPQQSHIYEYERASGNLTMRGPSSLGGYFLYYRCSAQK